MPTKSKTPDLWWVRLIKGDTYHPTDKGAVVIAFTAAQACWKYGRVVKPDIGPEGEFAGYEPTAEVVEMMHDVAIL